MHSYVRAKYKDSTEKDWKSIPSEEAAGTKKYDGAHYAMSVGADGYPTFISRRQGVKGNFPDRTAQLPHLRVQLPNEYRGNTYSVELIHSGLDKNNSESHPAVSGILNSLPDKAISTQKLTGPVRCVLLDVKTPALNTYGEKIEHLRQFEKAFGKSDVLYTPDVKIGHENIERLISKTRSEGDEGVIITSLTKSEDENTRIKVKHFVTHNLKVTGITQEFDKNGKPKESAGGLVVSDASGREVAIVGTGLTRDQRIHIWNNKDLYLNSLIQTKSRPNKTDRLISPVYNGAADGEIDTVKKI